MPLHVNNVCTDLYADDTTLYIIRKTIDEVQPLLSADFLRFSNWCQDNKLIVNVKKSKCMVICSGKYRTKMNNPTLHLSINKNVIDCVNELKTLGLLIDNNLTWKQHINTLSQKLSGIIGLLWRIQHFLSDNMKILFYNSYVLSRMDYFLSI